MKKFRSLYSRVLHVLDLNKLIENVKIISCKFAVQLVHSQEFQYFFKY